MSENLKFKTFCFEIYKAEKNISGKTALELFQKHKVFEYLESIK